MEKQEQRTNTNNCTSTNINVLSNKYNIIYSNNKVLVHKVINYIKSVLKINEVSLLSNTKLYIRELLFDLKSKNNEVKVLNREKDQIHSRIEDLKQCYCREQSIEDGGGFSNGLKPNTEYLRHIEIVQLKEDFEAKLFNLLAKEKTLYDNNQLVRDFINLIPQKQYIAVMEFAFLYNNTSNEIAQELAYSEEYVRQAKLRSINMLCEIVKIGVKNK